MKLICYADDKTPAGDRLLRMIDGQVSTEFVETYRSLADFRQGLLQQRQKPNAAVLMATNVKELKRIITLEKLLTDTRILLILPDRNKETVSAGHQLRPRYMSYADSDFADVVAVVKQILKLFPARDNKKGSIYGYDLKAVAHED